MSVRRGLGQTEYVSSIVGQVWQSCIAELRALMFYFYLFTMDTSRACHVYKTSHFFEYKFHNMEKYCILKIQHFGVI